MQNDRSEVILFQNDALLLWRPIDWIAFNPDWGFRLGDARQGSNRTFKLLMKQSDQHCDIGDGASLLVVLTDERGEPVMGDYVDFYGRSWLAS